MEQGKGMYCYKYPHPAVTTDCVVFGWDGKRMHVLLVERGREPHRRMWALPGGFLEMGEDGETGARRELQEETGLEVKEMRQFHAFTEPGRDPRERVVSIGYYAFVQVQEVKGADDAARAAWHDLEKLPALAFDHTRIVKEALQAARRQAYFEPMGMEALKEPFTGVELLKFYVALFGQPLTKGKVVGALLRAEAIGVTRREGSNRPGKRGLLYHFEREKCEAIGKENLKPIF